MRPLGWGIEHSKLNVDVDLCCQTIFFGTKQVGSASIKCFIASHQRIALLCFKTYNRRFPVAKDNVIPNRTAWALLRCETDESDIPEGD